MSSKIPAILAIDTSTEACSAALQVGDTLFERYENKPREHTRLLLPMIHSLLKEAGITLQALDALACTHGPGSFTGLRIGTAVIQGLTTGLNKPVILISTLRALAQTAYRLRGATKIFANLDARLEEVYWGLFVLDNQGVMQAQSEESLSHPKQIVLPSGDWFAWTGSPAAREVVRIAQFEFAQEHFVTGLQVQPVYLRNTVTHSIVK